MIKDKYGNKYYKLGLHIHSTLSDGKKTPEQIAEIYKNCGYDAIALTDHWNYGEACEINGMPVISGCEYNLGVAETIEGVMHIVGLGMKKDPMIEKDADRQSVIDSIIAVGGIPVLAHPAWSLNSVDDAARLHGFVATEIYNAVSEAHESLRPYSDYFVDLCANAGIYYGLLATDDAHFYDGSDSCRGFVMVRCDELEQNALMDAIRRGDYYASQGPELTVDRQGNKLVIDTSPCEYIGTISNLSWARGRVLRESGATHLEYEFKEYEKWVRVEVCDKDGRKAWSNIFVK